MEPSPFSLNHIRRVLLVNNCAKRIKGNKVTCSLRLGQHELITEGSPNAVDKQIHNGREKTWQMLAKEENPSPPIPDIGFLDGAREGEVIS